MPNRAARHIDPRGRDCRAVEYTAEVGIFLSTLFVLLPKPEPAEPEGSDFCAFELGYLRSSGTPATFLSDGRMLAFKLRRSCSKELPWRQ